jgi:hypothetical protein
MQVPQRLRSQVVWKGQRGARSLGSQGWAMCQAALARGRVGGGEGVGGVRGSWLRKGGCVMCNLWGGMRMIYVYIYIYLS